MKPPAKVTLRPFDVPVPNLEGDGVAETVRIEVPVEIDPVSGEEVLTPEAMELIEKTQARLAGVMSPAELRELRERLNLTQEQLSDLLQIGAKTYTRWEAGRGRPSRSLNLLLSALRDGVVTIEYLRALRSGGTTDLFARRLLDPDQWEKSHAWVYFESALRPRCWSEADIIVHTHVVKSKSTLRRLEARITHATHQPHQRHSALIPDRLPGAPRRWQWQDTAEVAEQ